MTPVDANTMEVKLVFTEFKPAWAGFKNNYLFVNDRWNHNEITDYTKYPVKGTWTVGAPILPPVADPVFSYGTGTYTSPISVSIPSTTAATIMFTMDTSAPS